MVAAIRLLATMARRVWASLVSAGQYEGFFRYCASTSWMLAEKLISIPVSILVTMHVARYLGPSDYGILCYALSLVAVVLPLATLGLREIVVRELVQADPESRDTILGTAFWLRVAGSALLLLLVAMTLFFSNNNAQTNLLVLVVAAGVVFDSLEVFDDYNRAKVQQSYSAIAMLTGSLVSSGVKILLIAIGAPLVWFAFASVLRRAIQGVGYFCGYVRRGYRIAACRFSVPLAAVMLRDSWPLILSAAAVSIYMRIDQVVLKSFVSAHAIGLYAVAVLVCETAGFAPRIVSRSCFPAIQSAKFRTRELFLLRLQVIVTGLVWAMVFFAVAMTLYGGALVRLVFGNDYAESRLALTILAWASVFAILGRTTEAWFISMNKTGLGLYRTTCGCITNLVLNALLIPHHGIAGAAWATLVSYGTASTLCLLPVARCREVLWLQLKALMPPLVVREYFHYAKTLSAPALSGNDGLPESARTLSWADTRTN